MKNVELQNVVIKILKSKKGEPITSKKMIDEIAEYGFYLNDSYLRKVVKILQRKRVVNYLIADKSGFYISRKKRDYENMIDVLRKKRDTLTSLIKTLNKNYA